MLQLPDEIDLISFFEVEPTLGSLDTPWEYNSITFEIVRGEDHVLFHLEPDVGELKFSWLQANIPRTNLKIDGITQISVHLMKNDEFLIASNGDKDPRQLLQIRLKPNISVELGSTYVFE